jgi:hypothetical protein
MIGRDRRYRRNRRVGVRGRVGIATAVLAGAAATAAAATAVVTGGHGTAAAGTAAKAAPAAYTSHYTSEGAILAAALNDWSWSHSRTYAELAKLTKVHGFSQVKHDGTTLDVQRGIVVLATKKFLILESSNHSLHLWLLSSHTKVKNVSASTAGTGAMTGNAGATRQAMTMNNMVPAANWMAGSTTTAANLLTATTAPQTVTVQVANTDLTVTVTITRKTATVSQTATTPTTGSPTWDPEKYTQYAWHTTASLTRGDLALVVGTRSHWVLHAQLVLFAPLSKNDVAGGPAPSSATPTATPTAMSTHQ